MALSDRRSLNLNQEQVEELSEQFGTVSSSILHQITECGGVFCFMSHAPLTSQHRCGLNLYDYIVLRDAKCLQFKLFLWVDFLKSLHRLIMDDRQRHLLCSDTSMNQIDIKCGQWL